VPDGRIQKDELMSAAFKRLIKNELGAESDISQAELIGPFEHLYEDIVSGEDFSTHYIALGYRLVINDSLLSLPTEQHDQYNWLPENELIKYHNVHKHTIWYFDL
jgi:colanic acid biosynthesis protein WcaH